MTRRAIGATTLGAGALLVIVGSLFPLFGVEHAQPPGAPEDRVVFAMTGWELVRVPPVEGGVPMADHVFAQYGYGLVLAAVLAGVGAALQFRSPRQVVIGRLAAMAGFGVVVGTLWTALENLRVMFNGPPGVDNGEFVGVGSWMLVVAALVLLTGVVLVQDWPARPPRPTGVSVYRVDDDHTPPFGIAVPVPGPGVPDPAAPVGHPLDRAVDVPLDAGSPVPPFPEPPGGHGRHPTGGNPSTVE